MPIKWLKTERKRRGLSQRALADKAGIAYKTIQLIESGRHDPRWSTLLKITNAVGIGPSLFAQLLTRTGDAARASLASASNHILRDGDASWPLWLMEFVDDFRRRPGYALIANAPDPGLSHRIQALLASTTEALCAENKIEPPWWCAGIPPLADPWFVAGSENLKATALTESPTQFRRRNIFVMDNFLSRA